MVIRYSIFASCWLFLMVNLTKPRFTESRCKAWLVQSIPTDMPDLRRVPGVLSTGDVFKWLAYNSTENLDIIAQYWQLKANPEDSRSGDYGYSNADMRRFGADQGFDVYTALENAADRDVDIRLLQHSGVYPDYTKEPSSLASGRPNVQSVTLLLEKWWGSGIVHAKVWVSDNRDLYIGSANNDWKSLTQVKEVGIYLVGCPKVARKVGVYFQNLWRLAHLDESIYTTTISDQQWQIQRKVPCWSHFIESDLRCTLQLPRFVEIPYVAGYPTLSDPKILKLIIDAPGYDYRSLVPQSSYLSFAPPELSFGRFQPDEQGWLDTIKSVGDGGTVRISTMDWLGQSQYMNQTVYWSSLSTAISEIVFSKHAKVKILVAYWSHFINNTDLYLKSLLYSNVLCSSSTFNKCSGKVQIKYYKVPGYNSTGPAVRDGKPTGNIRLSPESTMVSMRSATYVLTLAPAISYGIISIRRPVLVSGRIIRPSFLSFEISSMQIGIRRMQFRLRS
ncbi:BTB/POZ domain-containing protein NPY1-like [Hibiscus syriacus]|uniref:BTB/POZ domain-containing protein NPY1-like n=1 Tax=Hibiscus syriacus TaxID=106335 RepID=A0A6A3ACB9_HIBSY|nr:BTB/POZ domain-containing protein NPY1-like [Hibiscus syriacus]